MTSSSRPRLLIASVALVVSCLGRPAAAQDSSAAAESLFDEGRRLLAEKKYAEACAKLAESERLDPGVGTLLNLGDCWEKMGKTATAWAVFKQATAMAARAGQASREKTATARVLLLEPKIPRLVLLVRSPAPGLEVRRDGLVVGAAEWSADSPSAVAIDPGDHAIVASAPGKKPWTTTVTIAGNGETTRVEVPALETDELAERAPIAPPGAASSTEAVMTHDRNVQRAIAIAVGCVGVGAMIASAPLVARAVSLNKDAAGECPTSTTCTSAGQSDANSAVTLGTASTVLLLAGGGVVIGGVALYLTAPQAKHPKSARRWTPLIGPRSLGLVTSF